MTKKNPTSSSSSGESSGLLKFVAGIAVGAALAFGYVRWDLSLPKFLELPENLRGNLVSTAIESDLYDLEQPIALRRRALEVYFRNRAKDAAAIDAEFDHPFLKALYRKRAIRAARLLRLQWSAFDQALAKPALRKALAKRYGTNDLAALKQAMLQRGLNEKPFLKQWMKRHGEPIDAQRLLATLTRLSKLP